MDPWITSTIVIIIITLLFFTFFWIYVINYKEDASESFYSDAYYGYRCMIDESYPLPACKEGLKCIKYSDEQQWGYCKKDLGVPCNSLLECVPEATICSIVCSTTKSGGLNQKGPCLYDYLQEDEFGICKLKPETEGCRIDSDCYNSKCKNKKCIAMKENGMYCTNNYECISGNCNTYCQDLGIENGQEGATCASNQAPGCDYSLSCYIDYSDVYNESVNYGICEMTVKDWIIDTCSRSASCPYPSICWNGECVMPRNHNKFLTNTCSLTQFCMKGYSCTNGVCFPETNSPYESTKWGILKYVKGDSEVGFWELQTKIIYPPSEKIGYFNLFSVSLKNNQLIFVYKSTSGWFVYKNGEFNEIFFVSDLPEYAINVINVLFTPKGGILLTYYTKNSIYRCSYYEVIPDNFIFEVHIVDFPYNSDIGNIVKIDHVSIDDRNGINMGIIYNGDLLITSVDVNYINGYSNSYVFKLKQKFTNWSQVTSNINQYLFKRNSIYLMTETSIYPDSLPEPTDFNGNIIYGKILNQAMYLPVDSKISDSTIIYLNEYPDEYGGVQLRIYLKNNDRILGGYVNSNTLINIAINSDNVNTYVPTYYMLTTIY